jgi:hypothetical protein
MKKKILLSVFAFAVVVLAVFASYKTLNANAAVADLMLDENIEALTAREENFGYFVHHLKYYDPVTNLDTGKCTAFSYNGPNGPCHFSHNHGATNCCSSGC